MNKKWIIYIVLIVVAFVLIVVFSKNIYFWLSNQLWKISCHRQSDKIQLGYLLSK